MRKIEIQALNDRKQGKPRLHSMEHAREAAQRIAEQHRVHAFLDLHLDCTVHERTRRAYGARPTPSVREEQFTVTATLQERAVEEAIRRFGWRAYATDQDALALPLAKAVPAYREQYLIEPGFGRLKGLPWSLTPFYLQQEHRVMGLILLTHDRLAGTRAGTIRGTGKTRGTGSEIIGHLCGTTGSPDQPSHDRNDVARFSWGNVVLNYGGW